MTYDFSISPKEFDVSLLPPEARTVGSAEFGEAVHSYLTEEFEGFGGTARIIVSNELIQVTWNPDTCKPDPLQPAIEKVNRGQFHQAIQLLELLRSKSPNDSDLLYILGMALSDTGQLDRAVACLRKLVALHPGHSNGRVALGVALTRQNEIEEAIKELRAALKLDPSNSFGLRNLGACLLKSGRIVEAEEALRHAIKLSPSDQQAWFGLAEALFVQDQGKDADDAYRKVIEIDASSQVAELARERLGEIAKETFRNKTPGVERMDAVMYLFGAIEKFGGMSRQEVQKIGFEVAALGTKGFDVNDSSEKYQLRSLPGRYSGLHMVCLMFAAFKIIDPTGDIGFDLAKEYALAKQMCRDRRQS